MFLYPVFTLLQSASQCQEQKKKERANWPKGDGEKEKGNGGCDDLGDDGESAAIQDITGEKLGDH